MKKNKCFFLCCGISACIVLLIILWELVLPITGDEMGYALIGYYLIIPLVSLVCGSILGARRIQYGWTYPFFMGMLGFTMPLFVFGVPGFLNVVFAALPAIAGLLVGALVGLILRRIRS